MQLFAFTFAVLLAAFAAMALGVLFGRGPLRGGCRGLGSAACKACARPCPHREGATRGDAKT